MIRGLLDAFGIVAGTLGTVWFIEHDKIYHAATTAVAVVVLTVLTMIDYAIRKVADEFTPNEFRFWIDPDLSQFRWEIHRRADDDR